MLPCQLLGSAPVNVRVPHLTPIGSLLDSDSSTKKLVLGSEAYAVASDYMLLSDRSRRVQ